MQISLQSRPRKGAFLAVAVAAVFAYIAAVLRPWAADRAASSADLPGLERALALQGNNARYHYLLGRYAFYAELDTDRALVHYRAALELNPTNARYLLDLADLYEFSGNRTEQSAVLNRALAMAPYDPDVRWNAGLFYLVAGNIDEALRHFRIVVINSDSAESRAAMVLAWRATHDAERMLRWMIPPTASAHAELIEILLQSNQADAAEQVWSHWSALPERFAPQLAFPLIDFFIAQQRPASAVAVWRRLMQADAELRQRVNTGNLVTNSGFEDDVLNGGMDWRCTSNALATVQIDTTQFHGANRSLKIAFTGEEGSEAGVVQFVPVEPDTTYTFTGYMMTDEIYSAHGPQFGIFDLARPAPLLLTDEIVGTVPWTVRQGSFRTGPDTKLVQLKVVRGSGHIKGTVWIDDIQIVRGSVP
jgi:hypothetical protein